MGPRPRLGLCSARRFRRLAMALLACACTASVGHVVVGGDAAPVVEAVLPDARVAAAPPGPPYGPEVQSVRLRRSIVVRAEPREDAPALGTVAADTRVRPVAASEGPGCPRWIAIEPRGWICERYLEPSPKPPAGVELPKLKEGEIVPGVYGRVRGAGARAYANVAAVRGGRSSRRLAGSVMVRKDEEVRRFGRVFWKTTGGELIDQRQITVFTPSRFVGVRLDADGAPLLPMAWAQSHKDPEAKILVRSTPAADATVVRKLGPRALVSVLETTDDQAFVRVGEGEWVAARDLRVAWPTEPPSLTLADERWLDVDLDEQVLTAYEGTRPVYATLVSTGNSKWPTTPGIYRIWIKFAETDMNGQMTDEQPYSVATVPWTMFFAKDLALHTSYWHDRFGERRSHGCVNLSPADARALYFWTLPDVPPGWSMAYGLVARPGSIVRLRSKLEPEPEPVGYARKVDDARRSPGGGVAGVSASGDAGASTAETRSPAPPEGAFPSR